MKYSVQFYEQPLLNGDCVGSYESGSPIGALSVGDAIRPGNLNFEQKPGPNERLVIKEVLHSFVGDDSQEPKLMSHIIEVRVAVERWPNK